MRILLFSDSHGAVHNMAAAVNKNKNIDMIIHLGDCISDILKIRNTYSQLNYEVIRGNNDWSKEYPLEKCLEIEGKRILITQGHLYNVKYDYQRLVTRGKALNADAVFFGHTHKTEELFYEGMLILNPGTIGGISASSGRPTYCLIEISDGKLITRFMSTF
jgi:uncharacterized protein